MIIIGLYILIAICYLSVIIYVYAGWYGTSECEMVGVGTTSNYTVVVPCRNEENTIEHCLQSIVDQSYPSSQIKIIVVDDHSSDKTADVVRRFKDVQLLSLTDEYQGKKAGISEAVDHAKTEYVIAVDADCTFDRNWLMTIHSKLSKGSFDMVTGPVVVTGQQNWLTRAQSLDTAATMAATACGITRGSFYLANGANMAFRKEMFKKVGGYVDNKSIASGDDVFLIKSIVDSGGEVAFLKHPQAAAYTASEPTLSHLLRQRVRWASKSKAYASGPILMIQGITFFVASAILVGLVLSFGSIDFLVGVSVLISTKLLVDYLFLRSLCSYFTQGHMMKGFVISSILFVVYILYMGYVALVGKKVAWKGRT